MWSFRGRSGLGATRNSWTRCLPRGGLLPHGSESWQDPQSQPRRVYTGQGGFQKGPSNLFPRASVAAHLPKQPQMLQPS